MEVKRQGRYVHHGRDEAFGVAAPSLTTSNRATPIGADCPVITSHHEAPSKRKNILKRISTVRANLQHAAVEAKVRVWARCFKIEVVPEG
jgi:hypothetical protein